jgi:hypothetical protein
MDPVDEFARLRDEIADREARLKVLREAFLQPGARLRSNRFEVVVKTQNRRLFDRDKLPAAILDDARFWKVSTSQVVTVRALEGAPPGRATGTEDFEVIERF